MQVMVRGGEFTPRWAFPDRFDIREPDLRDPARHPKYPGRVSGLAPRSGRR
jgi:hypothetical protein